MLKVSFFLVLSFILNSAFATELTTTIGMVDEGKAEEKVLVMVSLEGKVLTVDKNDSQLLADLKDLAISQEEVILQVNAQDEITDFTLLPQSLSETSISSQKIDKFEPTNLSTIDEAKNLFAKMDGNTRRRSQCFNRAHIWAYEWNSQLGINSQKVFLFFTSRYIRRENYKWWFHVSPFVLVNSQEMVMDRSFTRGPLDMKSWTDVFMSSKATCPTVSQYSQYRQNQSAQDCYLIKTSMYYWEPNDIEALESRSVTRSNWSQRELEIAMRQAFRN